MLKIAVTIVLLAVACHGYVVVPDNDSESLAKPIGSYRDRPDLINSRTVKEMIVFAAEKIGLTEALRQKTLRIGRVQLQTVAGKNYKISFLLEPANGAAGSTTMCNIVVLVGTGPDKPMKLTQSQCQTS